MTLDRHDETPHEDAEHGILSDAGSVDTTAITILGAGTAQLQVALPVGADDDLDDDDDVIGDEIRIDEIATGDIILEELPAADSAHDGEDHVVDVYDVDVHESSQDESREDASEPGLTADRTVDDVAFEEDDVPFEDAASDDAVADDAVVDEAVADDAVMIDAVEVEDAVVDDASVEDAVVDAIAADETAVHDTVVEDTVVEEAAVEEAAVGNSAADDAAVDDAVGENADVENAADKPAAEPAVARPTAVPVAPAPARTTPVTTAVSTAAASAASAAPATASVPTTRREAHSTGAHARIERAHEAERVHTREPGLVLASKRLGEFEAGRESADLLTAERLLDPGQQQRPEPEGLWQQLVYSLSGRRINLGDGRRARARKELDRRISAPLTGGARFVPVLSRKGGVGKTTVTALLGMALADARDDRVIAVDANPDRGTLADRITHRNGRTVRDLVHARADVAGYNDISAMVARDETRLDVLSSDADPRVSEAFNDRDYRDVAVLAAHYYSLVLTDTGTGIVHSVMGATLELADQLVIVAGLSVDEARLASETLTWLETNGYAEQVRGAIVVLNNARPGAPLVRADELQSHFATRVRSVVSVPYDAAIATGSAIVYRDLQPATRQAARELAASVVEGLRGLPQAA